MIKNLLSNKKDAKIHKDIEEWLLSDDRMSGGQEGFLEGRKSGGQEGKPVNKTSPRPLREREEFVSERSELTNSGEGLKKCKLFNDSSLNDILLKPQNDTALSTYRPIALSPSNNKKLDCFAHARNDKSCATHTDKDLFASLEFAPRLQSFADVPLAQSAQSVRYPDFVRPQIRYSPIRLFTFKKAAFTLAEVMIVVVIIGVVAALVMPSFMQDMSERINSNRQVNVAQKITKSVELMIANGDYKEISNTEEFVNALSKYIKISKRCDSEHIADCWPTRKIKTAKGEYYEVSNAVTNKNLYVRGKDTTNNVGLVLADGASLIMTFNPNAEPPSMEGGFSAYSKSLPIGGGKYKTFAYSSNATNAIDFIMDVNGGSGPNQEPDLKGRFYDIRSFKLATFTPQACPGGTRISGYCLVELGLDYEPYNCYTKPNGGDYCGNNNYINHYYAGAVIACEELGMVIPTGSEFLAIRQAGISDWDFTKYITSDGYRVSGNVWGHLVGIYGSQYAVYDSIQSNLLCIKKDQ